MCLQKKFLLSVSLTHFWVLIYCYFFEWVSIMSPLTQGLASITHVAIFLFITIETASVNRGWVSKRLLTSAVFSITLAENVYSEIIVICHFLSKLYEKKTAQCWKNRNIKQSAMTATENRSKTKHSTDVGFLALNDVSKSCCENNALHKRKYVPFFS